MITAEILALEEQVAMTPNMRTALGWLVSVQGQELDDGRVEIDGTNVYALVQSYVSKPMVGQPRFEAHRAYADIQVIVFGKEQLGWAPVQSLEPTDEYNPTKDVIHGTVSSDVAVFVPLEAGQAMVFYPSDAHAPGLSFGDQSPMKKIVVKVRLG
ncbi:MAG: YhcH/YjgK/YiaL family protein [Anaerolineae bacterium]|nr:YhcH/YjgK/YiaL family protein [Anaerolineae bacterium]